MEEWPYDLEQQHTKERRPQQPPMMVKMLQAMS
jgi:hypothetical protein